MRLRIMATLIVALLTGSATAHEMWLQPSTFSLPVATPLKLKFLVGDAADVTPWVVNWDKLHSFKSYGPAGVVDQMASLRLVTPSAPENAIVQLSGSGTHMIALETYRVPHEMEAGPFNDYLAEDGLTPAIEQRMRTGQTGTKGTEVYSRRAKALIQVGVNATGNVLTPIGQTLEIVPERNPYALGTDRQLPVKVLYQGRKLPGALVALTALGTGSKPVQRQVTDAAGRAIFNVAPRGDWMVSVVWTRPMDDTKAADFDTIFTSLTFGYPGSHPAAAR